jgi:multiple sugar transport system permease protein
MSETTAGRKRSRLATLSRGDKLILAVMIGVPTVIHVALVWVPTLSSIALSFTDWPGAAEFSNLSYAGGKNYREITTIYPPFWPAVQHNVLWLAFFLVVPTSIGLFLAYLLDLNLRGSRIYQSVIFTPVVLSLALVGFIWELIYKTDPVNSKTGLLNNFIRLFDHNFNESWLGNPHVNIYAVMVAASWRQIGYVMILFLAGLKSVDPGLKEAAALDGAGEWKTFRYVTFPSLAPVNVVVLVVTIIESLRAFDIVYVINNGRNGLELLSVLVTDNIIGEASRIGYGSSIAVVLIAVSIIPIMVFVWNTFQEREV